MADFHCDHGAYASALGTTPTWGIPQEGDGSSINAAASSSIASVLCNGVAAVGNTIAICGVTLTAVASGATVTQFNVGASAQIQADNLAAAFNASTTAVGAGVAAGTPQLRNLLYARSLAGGAPANTVQIMMRIGSAQLNYATNSLVTITSAGWGTAPTITNFSGGTGGCYGWFINPAALGVSNSIAAMTYGLWFFKPYVGAPGLLDTTWVRTGDNPVITYTVAAAFNPSATYPAQLVFDTNTKWTGDSATGTLTLNLNLTTASTSTFLPCTASATTVKWFCVRKGNFALNYTNSSGGTLQFMQTGASIVGGLAVDGVAITDNSPSGIGVAFSNFGGVGAISSVIWRNIYYKRTVAVNTWPGLLPLFPNSSRGQTIYEGCTFDLALTGASNPGPVFLLGTATMSSQFTVILRNCAFLGYAQGIDLYNAALYQPNNTTSAEIIVEGCHGIKMPSAYLGIAASNDASLPYGARTFNYSDNKGGFRSENIRTVSEFVPGANYPTLSAYLFDAVTPWSMKLMWLNGVINQSSPGFTSPLCTVVRAATGIKTITLEAYLPSTLTGFTPLSGYVSFNYVDNNNVTRTESLPLTNIATSSAVWSAGYTSGYVAKKFCLVTAYQVLSGTEVTVQAVFTDSPPTGGAVEVFLDPALGIA